MCRVLIAISLWISLLSSAAAELRFREFVEGELRVIVVEGKFSSDDDLRPFIDLAQRTESSVVTFDSEGGNVLKAIALGELIRSLGLSTVQFRATQCTSSCALAFLGGVYRIAEPGSIGVHRNSFSPETTVSAEQAVTAVQALTADLVRYLRQMGVDPSLLEVAYRYDSTDMRYLSGSEMDEYRVTREPESGEALERAPYAAAPNVSSRPPAEPQPATRARNIVENIIAVHHGSDEAALRSVAARYGSVVTYYGKDTALSAVLEDKRRYFDRWPTRSYRLHDGRTQSRCGVSACVVSGVYDWTVSNLAKRKALRGTATFRYVLAPVDLLLIVGEDGEVTDRR